MKAKSQTLNGYIKSKLGLSVKEFADIDGTPTRTLSERWKKEDGRKRIMESVHSLYVRRFDEL